MEFDIGRARSTTVRDRIRHVAIEILERHPEGVRYSELVRMIMEADPTFNLHTVSGYIADPEQTFPGTVYRPSRGVFRLVAFQSPQESAEGHGAAPAEMDGDRAVELEPALDADWVQIGLTAAAILAAMLLVGLATGYLVWAGMGA
ncbi:MAG TPA: hypothetical protein VFC51_03080 [Chloroflexota bacterium]|nr:hypothetical protein [Chloroflexota bacterium]